MCKRQFRRVAKGLLTALGEEIRAKRARRDMTQDELAAEAGIHRNFVGLIERGQRNVTVVVLEAIADVLEVSLSQLLAGAERRRGK